MKKSLAFVLMIGLTLFLPTTAFASEIIGPGTKTGSTTITYNVDPAYSVTIPTDIKVEFNKQITNFGTVELSKAQIEPSKCVKVTLNASGTLKNTDDSNKTIPYAIKSGNTAFSSETYLTAGDKTELAIHIEPSAWDAAFAGKYSDTVTFTISYETK